MSSPLGIIIILILIGIAVRTVSYALWSWKHNSKSGAVFLLFLCLATIILPVYLFFFRT